MSKHHIIISGAGILGLATGYTLLKKDPDLKVTILEKESEVAKHQTGHNSGVIHSGIYYKPGSHKARNCVRGVELLIDFCHQNDISYDLCGKLIIATNQEQLPALKELYRRGTQNGVKDLKLVCKKQFKDFEPHAVGEEAIWSPNTGIIDYKEVSKKLQKQIEALGGQLKFNSPVQAVTNNKDKVLVETTSEHFEGDHFINCSGLYSDTIARKSNPSIKEKIVPFRGEYYFLKPEKAHLLKGLIYPVPDPRFPFLGVHLTKRITGEVEVGPNAVLAFAKEGYRKTNINLSEMHEYLTYNGFWKMAFKYWKMGCYEMYRSFSKKAFVKDIQKLVPAIESDDLIPGGAGVRAQSVTPEGKLVDDFLIKDLLRQTHILNAPSPAATSCLAIAENIVQHIEISKTNEKHLTTNKAVLV